VVMTEIPSPAAASWASVPQKSSPLPSRTLCRDRRPRTSRHAAGQGMGKSRGLNHPSPARGMVRADRRGTLGLVPSLGKQALENKIEAYCFRRASSHTCSERSPEDVPGVISTVGKGHLRGPAPRGGKMNEMTAGLIEVLRSAAQVPLLGSFPINIALLRGTTADEEETSRWRRSPDARELSIAQAVRGGGIVIVQVEKSPSASQPSGGEATRVLVDCVVVINPRTTCKLSGSLQPCLHREIKVSSRTIADP